MSIEGNRYQLNERINKLKQEIKKVKEENKNLKNEKRITLKNIDLTGISIEEQVKKIQEEDREFVRAINESDLENAKEEFWDLIQARLGLLDKLGIPADEVMKGYPKHIKKLEKRGNKPRIKECIKCNWCYMVNIEEEQTYKCEKLNEDICGEYAPTCKYYNEQEE